jgi:fibronectin type 3 domain-containing protein
VGSAEFVISGLPVTIPAGQSANFTVTFTPQASGAASVGASFTSNASNSPASATVTGTGVAAPVHTVSLSWTASTSPNIVGYNIYRRTGTTGSFTQINSGLIATTTYVDTSVADGQTYYYETTAVNSTNEESEPTTPVSAVIPAP